MSKFLKVFLVVCALGSNFYASARGFWATVLVDGGGALGGAASAAQFCKHPLCLAGGAIIGGAAASLARGENPLMVNITFNPKNQFDFVGKSHNDIMSKYHSSYYSFDVNQFWTLAENKQEFNTVGPYTIEVAKKEVNDASQLDIDNMDTERLIDYLVGKLPANLSPEPFRNTMTNLLKADNLATFNEIILNEENHYLQQLKTDEEKAIMGSFFSVLRFSAGYWNK